MSLQLQTHKITSQMDKLALQKIHELVAFLAKTSGRDKLLRLLQYGGLFMAERDFAESSPQSVVKGKKWLRVSSEMRTARKVLRFLRTIEYARKIFDSVSKLKNRKYKNSVDVILILTTVLSSFFTILFFLYDHLVFLIQTGILSRTHLPTHLQKSFKFWMLQCIFSIARDLTQIVQVKSKLNNSINVVETEDRISELTIDIIKNLLDALIGYARITPGTLSTGNIGLVGTITSVMGVYQVWG